MQTLRFDAIGTRWRIDHSGDANVESAIAGLIDRFDREFSRFRDDSWVNRIYRHPGTHDMSSDASTLLSFYRKLYDATDGRVTPLIGTVMEDAGYDKDYSFVSSPFRDVPKWNAALTQTNDTLTTTRPVLLDLGAAGKGMLIDKVAQLLEEAGVREYVIDAGGDIRHAGQSEITVGLENPADATEAVGTVTLANAALCGSSGNRRAWGRFTHIIDPELLASPSAITAVWVKASDAMTADGLATALFFTEPDLLKTLFDFDYALIDRGIMRHSRGFAATVFAGVNA